MILLDETSWMVPAFLLFLAAAVIALAPVFAIIYLIVKLLNGNKSVKKTATNRAIK